MREPAPSSRGSSAAAGAAAAPERAPVDHAPTATEPAPPSVPVTREELERMLAERQNQVLEYREAIYRTRKQRVAIQERQRAKDMELLDFAREEWGIERGFELEDLASYKMDLRDIREKLSLIENAQTKNLVDLDAIDKEKQARQQASRDRVARAIASDKTGHLAKGLGWDTREEEEKREIADRVIREENQDGLSLVRQLVQEMEMLRHMENEQAKSKRRAEVQKLNAERSSIEARLLQLQKQKKADVDKPDPNREALTKILKKIDPGKYKTEPFTIGGDLGTDKTPRVGGGAGGDGGGKKVRGFEDILGEDVSAAAYKRKVESELSKDEEKIDYLEDEMGDIEFEERWLRKWEAKGPEWADVQRRMMYLDRHRDEMQEELEKIEEEQAQVRLLRELWDKQTERNAEDRGILSIAHEIEEDIVRELLQDVVDEHTAAHQAATRMVTKGILMAVVASQGYEPSGIKGLEVVLKGTLREMQRERKQADETNPTYFRPAFALRYLRDADEDRSMVLPSAEDCQPCLEPLVLCMDDAFVSASRLRAQRCKPLLEGYSCVPYDPVDARRWFVPEVDRIVHVGQLIDRVADREREWWLRSVFMPIKPSISIPLQKEHGGCTAVALSRSLTSHLTFLAAGTSKGDIMVWMVRPFSPRGKNLPLLLRTREKDTFLRGEAVPIKSLAFSLDGVSQLLSLDALGTVCLWNLAPPTSASDEPARHTEAFRARALALRQRIMFQDLQRPDRRFLAAVAASTTGGPNASGAAASNKNSKAGGAGGAVKDEVTCMAFHPALTVMANQPSFVVGTGTGPIVKLNTDTREAEIQSGKSVYGLSCATYEPAHADGTNGMLEQQPQPNLQQQQGGGKNAAPQKQVAVGFPVSRNANLLDPTEVKREYHDYHRCPIIFLGFVDLVSLDMVSLDEAGRLALWPYSDSHFTGYKWFRPARTARLELTHIEYRPISQEQQGPPRVLYRALSDKNKKAASMGVPLPPAAAAEEAARQVYALESLRSMPLKVWRSRPMPDGSREDYLAPADDRNITAETAISKDGTLVDLHVTRLHELESGDGKKTERLLDHVVVTYRRFVRAGKLLMAKMTSSGRELVLLVSYKGEGDSIDTQAVLRFFLLKLDGLILLPTTITYTIPPPSVDGTAGGSVSSSSHNMNNMRIDFTVTPMMEPTQTDYLYLVAGSELAVFSLSTGQRVQPKMSDADKGFNFIMRGVVPGSFPPWKFEICAHHKWLVQFCGEVQEIRLRHIESPATTQGAAQREDFKLWCHSRALGIVLGRGRPPLEVTAIRPYDTRTVIDLADIERLSRLLLHEICSNACDESEEYRASDETVRVDSRAGPVGTSPRRTGEAAVLSFLGPPPFGRIQPTGISAPRAPSSPHRPSIAYSAAAGSPGGRGSSRRSPSSMSSGRASMSTHGGGGGGSSRSVSPSRSDSSSIGGGQRSVSSRGASSVSSAQKVASAFRGGSSGSSSSPKSGGGGKKAAAGGDGHARDGSSGGKQHEKKLAGAASAVAAVKGSRSPSPNRRPASQVQPSFDDEDGGQDEDGDDQDGDDGGDGDYDRRRPR